MRQKLLAHHLNYHGQQQQKQGQQQCRKSRGSVVYWVIIMGMSRAQISSFSGSV